MATANPGVDERLQSLRKLKIIKQALDSLAKNLPASLKYHVASHTDDVLHEVVTFAVHDGLDDRTIELLAVGAAYHDLGFIQQLSNNEELGAQMARDAMLKAGGYSEEEIKQVASMIIDTRVQFTAEGMRQIATDEVSAYLVDADVSNLGRHDFFEKAEAVREEIGMENKSEFLLALLQFLEAQKWYTPAAKALRQPAKEANHKKLLKLLGKD